MGDDEVSEVRISVGAGGIVVRGPVPEDERPATLGRIVAALAAAGSSAVHAFNVLYPAGEGVAELLAPLEGTPEESVGWELLVTPGETGSASRRIPRLPDAITLGPGLDGIAPEALRSVHSWGSTELDHPWLDNEGSFVIRNAGEFLGWIPVRRLSPTNVGMRSVLLPGWLHHDEPTRRTVVRLGCFARAMQYHLDAGSSVVCWLPDDGDPVNDYKEQVGAATWYRHWLRRHIRIDTLTSYRDAQASAT